MRSRIVAVDTAPEHADRQAAGLERSAVGFPVDAAREPAHDDEADAAELATEHPRDLSAIGRARARTDDGDRGTSQQLQARRAANEQPRRRIVDRVEQRRELGRRASDPANALAPEPRE